MELLDRAQRVRDRFQAGGIPIDELILHIEPLLLQASPPTAEVGVRKIVNDIERAIHTQVEPHRNAVLLDLLNQAVEFIRRHAG